MSRPELTSEERPCRKFMDDPNTKWRHGGPPDYTKVDATWLKQRTKHHKPGSLEHTVENFVKTFEMEASHKIDPKDWKTVDVNKFTFSTNGGEEYNLKELIREGTYNCMMEQCPYYDSALETHKTSHDSFKSSIPNGFAWELLEIVAGPPNAVFTWRHFADWEGSYKGTPPDGRPIELIGVAVCKLSEASTDLKVESLQLFFDPNPMMARMCGNCPVKKL